MDVEMLMAENGKIHIFYQSFGADWMTPDINMKLGLKERAHFFCTPIVKKMSKNDQNKDFYYPFKKYVE